MTGPVLAHSSRRIATQNDAAVGVVAPRGTPIHGFASIALVANQAYFARFTVDKPTTVTLLSFYLSTPSGVDDPVDVGIYDGSLARLVSSGAVTGKLNAAAGVQTVTVAGTTLVPNVPYYAALSANSTALLGMAQFLNRNFAQLLDANQPDAFASIMAAAHPLPASATFANTVDCVALGVRES